MESPADLLSAEEAAHILGVTARHVRRLVAAGTLPGAIVSGSYVIRRADLDAVAARTDSEPA